MIKSIHVLIFSFCCCLTSIALGQTSNSSRLNSASKLYEDGKLNEALDSALLCTDDSLSVSVRYNAYRLLAIIYLANNDNLNARKSARKMLELNPTYSISEQDPFDFISLLHSIKVIPSFTAGVAATIGYNRTYPKVISTYNGANYTKAYTSENGWQYGVVCGYTMNTTISLHGGIIASSKSFGINYDIDSWSFAAKEQAIYLDFPIHARFRTKVIRGVSAYADVGVFAGGLISYSSDFSRTSLRTGETFTMNNINRKADRNKWAYGSLFGAGFMFKVRKVDITVDGRYYGAAFSNITNKDKRLEVGNLFYNFYYMDDDVRLNSFAISLTLLHHFNYRVLTGK